MLNAIKLSIIIRVKRAHPLVHVIQLAHRICHELAYDFWPLIVQLLCAVLHVPRAATHAVDKAGRQGLMLGLPHVRARGRPAPCVVL